MPAIVNAPIILDAGKTSRKNIREVRQGRGKIMDDVQDAVSEVTASLGDQADGKQLIPVILVYSKKRRRSGGGGGRRGGGLFPVLF